MSSPAFQSGGDRALVLAPNCHALELELSDGGHHEGHRHAEKSQLGGHQSPRVGPLLLALEELQTALELHALMHTQNTHTHTQYVMALIIVHLFSKRFY